MKYVVEVRRNTENNKQHVQRSARLTFDKEHKARELYTLLMHAWDSQQNTNIEMYKRTEYRKNWKEP